MKNPPKKVESKKTPSKKSVRKEKEPSEKSESSEEEIKVVTEVKEVKGKASVGRKQLKSKDIPQTEKVSSRLPRKSAPKKGAFVESDEDMKEKSSSEDEKPLKKAVK